jgi:hypothetical protein
MNGNVLAYMGVLSSLVNSFTASAMGWGIPLRLTLLGPFRSWMYPKIFRSSRVKNAIASKIQTKIINTVKIDFIYIILGYLNLV